MARHYIALSPAASHQLATMKQNLQVVVDDLTFGGKRVELDRAAPRITGTRFAARFTPHRQRSDTLVLELIEVLRGPVRRQSYPASVEYLSPVRVAPRADPWPASIRDGVDVPTPERGLPAARPTVPPAPDPPRNSHRVAPAAVAAPPRHFLHVLDTAAPFARFAGLGENWRAELLDDLTGAQHAELRYLPAPGGGERPCIYLFGEKLRCRATRHDWSDDALFVFEIMPADEDQRSTAFVVRAAFDLWTRRDRGTALSIPHLPERPTADVTRRIEGWLSADEGQWLEKLRSPDASSDHRLAAARRKFPVFFPDHSAPANSAATFYRALNLCVRRIPGQLEPLLDELLAIPPPLPVLEWITSRWVNACPPALRQAYMRAAQRVLALHWSGEISESDARLVVVPEVAAPSVSIEQEVAREPIELVRERLNLLFQQSGAPAEDASREVEQLVAVWQVAWPGAVAWLDRVTSWAQVVDVFRLASHDVITLLPSWIWTQLVEAETSVGEAVYAALADANTREEVRRLVDWVSALPEHERAVVARTPGSPGVSPIDALTQAVAAKARDSNARAAAEALAQSLGPWAERLVSSATELTGTELHGSFEALARDLRAIERRCDRAIFEAFCREFGNATTLKDAHDALNSLQSDFDELGDELGDFGRLEAIRKHAARKRAEKEGSRREGVRRAAPVTFDHCLSDPNIRQAPLYLRVGPRDMLVTDVPLDLRSDLPIDIDGELELFEALHLQGRPVALPKVPLRIRSSDWIQMRTRKSFSYTVVIEEVPVAPSREDGRLLTANNAPIERLQLGFRLPGHGDGRLAFDRLVTDELPSPLFQAITDTTTPDEMRAHPLGLQVKFDKLDAFFRQGAGSVLVAAPRRFGKTTLLRSLVAGLADAEVVVPGFVTAGVDQHSDPIPPDRVTRHAFQQSCAALARAVQSHVGLEWQGDLPGPNDLDDARAAAFAQGKRAIYLLFDEAQALFRGPRGRSTAETLKARIETSWGVKRPGLAPVRVGLFGQLHLVRLIQGQLDGVFGMRLTTDQIQEDEIRGFLEARARGVLSTADARKYIAEASRSFMVLRQLLVTLEETLQRARRAWMTRHDVDEALRTVVSQALDLQDAMLRTYLRDPLNASDDLTTWRPVASYPVALAWAAALEGADEPRPRRIERVAAQLGSWMKHFVPGGEGLSIIEERVTHALDELRDLGVLRRDETFASSLLQTLLARTATSALPFDVTEEVRVLQALSVDDVTFPPEAVLVDKGGEATVYQVTEPRPLAIRESELADERKRTAFIQTCRALKAIEGTRARDVGFLSLPCVRQAGLRADDRTRGLVIYDWIPGSSLVDSAGLMDDTVVADVGLALAQALVVLEGRQIVHRDIKPENVIMHAAGRPVLIDFGLARLRDFVSDTRVVSRPEFLAPEVRSDTPAWSSKSDVFALASLLAYLRRTERSSKELDEVIEAARAKAPEKRSSPVEMVTKLTALAKTLAWEDRRRMFVIDAKRHAEEYTEGSTRDLALRFHVEIAAARGGWHPPIVLVQVVATFLDAVFADFYAKEPGEKLIKYPYHLANAHYDRQFERWTGDRRRRAYKVAGLLRHAASHKESLDLLASARGTAREMNRRDDDATLKQLVIEASEQVEGMTRTKGLSKLARTWLR